MVVAKKQVPIENILSAPNLRADLQARIDAAVQARTEIADLREELKVIREAAVDALGITPKMFNTLVSLYFNNDFEKKAQEVSELENVLAFILSTNGKAAQKSIDIDDINND